MEIKKFDFKILVPKTCASHVQGSRRLISFNLRGGGGGKAGGGLEKEWGNFCIRGVLAHIDKRYTPCKFVCVCIFFAFLATAEEVSPEGKVPSMLRTGTEYEASGSTRDIHELQAALQAAQLTVTGTGSRYSGKISFIMKTLIELECFPQKGAFSLATCRSHGI